MSAVNLYEYAMLNVIIIGCTFFVKLFSTVVKWSMPAATLTVGSFENKNYLYFSGFVIVKKLSET